MLYTYEDLMSFVERNHYEDRPFYEVIQLYNEEAKEYFDCMQPDEYRPMIHSIEITIM